MRRPVVRALCVLAAVAAGVFAAHVDLHNDDVQATVLILSVSGFVLALIRPRVAWVCAAILGVCIPLAHLHARIMGTVLPYELSLPATLLAFIPAFVGAYAGVWLRRMMVPSRR